MCALGDSRAGPSPNVRGVAKRAGPPDSAPGVEADTPTESDCGTVLAILPDAPWADELLSEPWNPGCHVLRRTCTQAAPSAAARHRPGVIVWGCPPTGPAGSAASDLTALRAHLPETDIVVVIRDAEPPSLRAYCELVTLGVRSLVDGSQPDAPGRLAAKVAECLDIRSRKRRERSELRDQAVLGEIGLVGESLIDRGVLSLVEQAAALSDVPVLIWGETGTGKQLLAEAIHRFDDKRRDGPMISVNCAAISEGLADSALFGHRQGAFTGASAARPGYFRAADGGTLFLDEVGELTTMLQAKLLRVIEAGRVMAVGEDREHPVDVRVVAASNQRLDDLVEAGAFRRDLYHRLSVIRIDVPPLRERAEDVPALLQWFLQKYAHYYGGRIEEVEPAVLDVLSTCPMTGNVREFENIVRYALLSKRGGSALQVSDLPADVVREVASAGAPTKPEELKASLRRLVKQGGMGLSDLLDYCERAILAVALEATSHNRTRAARMLRTSRRTVQNKIRKHLIT